MAGQVFDILANFDLNFSGDGILSSIGEKLGLIQKQADIPVTIDTTAASEGIGTLNAQVSTQVQSIAQWKASLKDLKAARDQAEDTATLQQLNSQIATAEQQVKALSTPMKEAFNTSSVQSFESEVSKIPGHMKEAESSASGFGESLKDGLGLAAGFLGVQGVGSFLEGSVEAFGKEDQAARGLGLAFSDLGDKRDAMVGGLEKYAEAQSNSTTFTKDEIEQTLQLGKQLGGIKDQAKLEQFSTGLQNFAAATGKSLDEVSQGIAAKLEAGGRDRTLGITFNPGDTQGNIDKFLSATQQKFGGFAQNIANSDTGSITLFKKDMEEAEGAIGGVFVQVLSVVAKPMQFFTGLLKDAGEFMQQNRAITLILAAGVGALAISLTAASVGAKLAAAGELILNAAMDANPIGIIILALAGLAAAGVYLYEHVQPVHDLFDGIWNVLKEGAAFISGFVTNEVGALVKGFKGVGDVLDGIIHLNFDEVKKGAGEVGDAVVQHISSPFAGAKAAADSFKGSVDNATDSNKKLGETAAQAAQAAIDKYNQAKAAYDEYAKHISTQNTSQATDVKTEIANITGIVQHDLNQLGITQAQYTRLAANGFAGSTDAQKGLLNEVQANLAVLPQWQSKLGEVNSAQAQANLLTGQATDDLISKAQKLAGIESNKLQIKLEQTANDEKRSLTSQEELQIAQKQLDAFNGQVKALNVAGSINLQKTLDPAKAGEMLQTLADVRRQFEEKDSNLQFKVSVDLTKAQDDLQSAQLQNKLKAIDVQVNPQLGKEDTILGEIALLQTQYDRIKLSPDDPVANAQAETAQAQIAGKILDLQKQIHDQKLADDKSEADSQIALLNAQADAEIANAKAAGSLTQKITDDAIQKKSEALKLAAEQQAKPIAVAEDSGIPLSQEQANQKQLIEIKLQQDLLALRSQYAKDAAQQELSIFSVTADGLLSIWKDFNTQKKVLDSADVADKELGFQQQQADLQRSLDLGTASQETFNVKMAKLASDRATFEQSQQDSTTSKLQSAADTVFGSWKKSLDDELAQFIATKAAEILQAQVASIQMSVAQAAGDAAAIASLKAKQVAQDSANATTLAGIAYNIAAGWSSIPFVGEALGIAAAIATTVALNSLISSAIAGRPTLGFADGGLGVVGEEGIGEVFGPVSDFSQFSSQLALQTAQATERALTNRAPATNGQNGSVGVRLSGQTTLEGRTLVTGLQRETAAQNNERLIPA